MNSAPLRFACFCVLTVASTVFSTAATTPPKLVESVAPKHPQELYDQGVDGRAKLSFRILADGTVAEPVVLEATEPGFGEAATAAVLQWKFDPATRDGAPIAIKVAQEFKFDIPPEKKLEALAGRPVFVELVGETVELKSLKENQHPKWSVPLVPLYPKNLAGSGKEAVVRMKWVVTPEGLPVNPEIVSNEGDPVFATMALLSVIRARWEPVAVEGKPVNISMTLPLRFRENPPAGERPKK
jgi:TonB family protein